jgi:glycerophosphoryl diester phosphodiesterase
MKVIYILACSCLAACTSSKKQTSPATAVPMLAQTFDKQGHRGARGLMPENTVAAMRTALDLGVTTLEMDVVITKDKKVVLSHEPFFNHQISLKPDGSRVTAAEEKSLNIYSMTYDEVKRFDVGSLGNPAFPKQKKVAAVKPLLADVIDSVNAYMVTSRRPHPFYNIETKSAPGTDGTYHPEPGEFVDLLMEVIRSKKIEDRVIIQSFDMRTLQYLHVKYPAVKTALLLEFSMASNLQEKIKKLGFMPNIISPHYKAIYRGMVDDCHKQGMLVIPWTINDRRQMDELKALGVDGIITDYPDLFDSINN